MKARLIVTVAVIAALGLTPSVSSRSADQPAKISEIQAINSSQYTRPEIERLANAVFAAMDTGSAENSYIPTYAKKKFAWLLAENRKGTLKVNLDETPVSNGGNVGMASATYDTVTNLPAIQIMVRPLAAEALASFEASGHVDPALKNNFYVMLVHEIIHLEQGRETFVRNMPRGQRLYYEMHTWAVTSKEVVRPISQAGQPLYNDFLTADLLLRNCHDDWQNCPLFRQFVYERIGAHH